MSRKNQNDHGKRNAWREHVWDSVTRLASAEGYITHAQLDIDGMASRFIFKREFDALLKAYDIYGPHNCNIVPGVAAPAKEAGSFGIGWVKILDLSPSNNQTELLALQPRQKPDDPSITSTNPDGLPPKYQIQIQDETLPLNGKSQTAATPVKTQNVAKKSSFSTFISKMRDLFRRRSRVSTKDDARASGTAAAAAAAAVVTPEMHLKDLMDFKSSTTEYLPKVKTEMKRLELLRVQQELDSVTKTSNHNEQAQGTRRP